MLFKRKKSEFNNVDHIIVGLGNPGQKYEFTRHNVGFMAIDYIADQCGTKVNNIKFKSLCSVTKINELKVLLMKPSTFMNLSGEAVVSAMNFYKVPAQNVIIIFDDISFDPGKLRIRRKGSSGGHNGMKNIIYLSGQDTFPRIKLGVGQKPNPCWDLSDWVLSRFTQSELSSLKESIQNTYEAIKLILNDQIDYAMSKYNS